MARRKKRVEESLNDYHAFSYEEVQVILKYFGIPSREFDSWFEGQTGIILPDGTKGFFQWDVERFAKAQLKRRLRGLACDSRGVKCEKR